MGMGEPFVPATQSVYDAEYGIAFGKAFDCKAGVTVLLLALRELSKKDLPFDVMASIVSMEEVGERGVAVAVRTFQPKLTFMFEGCPADDVFLPSDDIQAALYKGPIFRYFDCCMITNPRYQRYVLATAREHSLRVQTSMCEGGSADGESAHMLDVPSVVVGVPCRYVYAGCAICALDDIEEVAKVCVAVAESLTLEEAEYF